jgi:hypothetical protein
VSSPDSPARRSADLAAVAPQAFDVDQPVDGDGLYGLRETLLWICRCLTAQLSIEAWPDGHGTIVTATLAAPNHQRTG